MHNTHCGRAGTTLPCLREILISDISLYTDYTEEPSDFFHSFKQHSG